MFRRIAVFGLMAATLGLSPAVSDADNPPGEKQLISLDKPGDREFVRDLAHLIEPSDQQQIVKICDRLLTDKATPIIVVTINSMADHGGDGMRIETFAHLLFDQWGIGVAKINGQDWNTGILLLVSKGDRKARIELGGYWRHENDVQCQNIMEQTIIPNFKSGNFSGGILAGVEALDKMARGLALPQAAATQSSMGGSRESRSGGMPIWLTVLLIGLGIFTVVSLIRSGTSGWSWLLWGAVFSVIGYLLYSFINSSGSSGSSGGGFSGGSFGGGFSGGGGSTGSW